MKTKKIFAVEIPVKTSFSTTTQSYNVIANSIELAGKKALRIAKDQQDFMPQKKLFIRSVFYHGLIYI